jgi:endoglucanase
VLDTVKKLCSLSGVSGTEDEVRDYIISRVSPYADEIKTDSMGNLLVFKRGARAPEKKVMLAAHMDEVGLIITSVEDDGYLRFSCVGGIDRRVLIGKRVFIGENKVPGITGIKAYHLVSASEEKNVPKVDEMYIDIGADSREAALELVSLGDTASFDGTCYEFGDGYLKAKAIDDRAGCSVMIKLLERDLPVDTWFAFTVQEEVGTRGATVAAYTIDPEIALILEGTTAADLPEVDGGKRICTLTDGVVIPFMDGGTIYDRALVAKLGALADEAGIPHQTKQRIAGGTDASVIQRSRTGTAAAAVSCAVRSIHSPVSVARCADLENMLKLAELFLKNV